MGIVLIAALAENNVIGFKGDLPWRDWKELTKKDLPRFKKMTLNKSVVMGRKTYESIPERFRPLPERSNVIVSGNVNYCVEGALVVSSVPEGLKTASRISSFEDIYVIGGESVYKETLPIADRLEITEIHRSYEGEAFFPEFDRGDRGVWVERSREENEGFDFVRYERR